MPRGRGLRGHLSPTPSLCRWRNRGRQPRSDLCKVRKQQSRFRRAKAARTAPSRARGTGFSPPCGGPGSPAPGASPQDSRAAVGDELLQLGQVDLAVHSLGLSQRAHVQSDDVLGQHLAGRQRGPWVSRQALPSLGPSRSPAGGGSSWDSNQWNGGGPSFPGAVSLRQRPGAATQAAAAREPTPRGERGAAETGALTAPGPRPAGPQPSGSPAT